MAQRPELVIGFVGPAGVDLKYLCDKTAEFLKEFKYHHVEIRLSRLLERYPDWTTPTSSSEYDRVLHLQKAAHDFRSKLGNAAAIALASLVAIREERQKLSGSPDRAADATAYLLNQLKHPDEVKLLRKVYGSSFVLIAAHAPKLERELKLIDRIAASEHRERQQDDLAKANNIIRIDDREPAPFMGDDQLGQNTRDTYPLADMFVDLEHEEVGAYQVRRFVEMLFGEPFHSPRPDEVAMHYASAAALRSSDESRQVGAVIAEVERDIKGKSTNVEVLATGMNEVPMRGGGFYWDGAPGSPDARDQWLNAYSSGGDRALAIKRDVLRELIEAFKQKQWFKEAIEKTQTPALLSELIPDGLKGSQYLNIGEFQRQVHAEMAALIDSAKRGVAVDGHTMYVTSFPCHNCAKHIIAAGLRRVIYLEPYPKSRAETLHGEEIDMDPRDSTTQTLNGGKENTDPKYGTAEAQNGAKKNTDLKDGAAEAHDCKDGVPEKVVFMPYTGIAPRQYRRLFGMTARGKKALLGLKDWGNQKATLSPVQLVENAFSSYAISERNALATLPTAAFGWDPRVILPD